MENLRKKEIENSRCLITGGLGFVGSAIARRLLRENVKKVVLFDVRKPLPDILIPERSNPCLEIVEGDIRNPEDVQKEAAGCDYVFHQAALRVTKCAQEPRLAHEIMVDGTFNVITACAENKVKKVILASSAIVYGRPNYLPLDEIHPVQDTTLYGIFKVFNENLLRSFRENHSLDYTVLRYFNIYGPGMNLFGPEVEVLIRWLDRLDAGLPPLIFGDGKQTLDWIFIDDIVEANWLALLSEIPGETYNVCTGKETPLLDVLRLLLKIRHSEIMPEFREKRLVNHVERRYGNPQKAEQKLGFRAQVSLEEGLRQFVQWRDQILAKAKEKIGS